MLLKEIMTDEVESITPDTSIAEAAQRMRDFDVGILPVCDEDELLGVLTDRDIVLRAVADSADIDKERVERIMSVPVFFCFDDQTVEEAAEVMEQRQVRRIVVLNREEKVVGIVSLGDLALDSDDPDLAGEILEGVSEERDFEDEDEEDEATDSAA